MNSLMMISLGFHIRLPYWVGEEQLLPIALNFNRTEFVAKHASVASIYKILTSVSSRGEVI